mgnify:CR=1 FL=1
MVVGSNVGVHIVWGWHGDIVVSVDGGLRGKTLAWHLEVLNRRGVGFRRRTWPTLTVSDIFFFYFFGGSIEEDSHG